MNEGSLAEQAAALGVIGRALRGGAFANLTLKAALADERLAAPQKAFVTAAADGVLRRLILIDYIIGDYCDMKRLHPLAADALRLGAFQLLFMGGKPDYAVVDTLVELIKRKKLKGLAPLINGVLRNIARSGGDVRLPAEGLARLSVQYACPAWFAARLADTFGFEAAEAALAACLEPPVLTARVNVTKTDAAGLTAALTAEGVRVAPGGLPNALYLSGEGDVSRLAAFRDGLFHIMDESAQLAAELAAGGQSVTDLCAAPGGKAFLLAQSPGAVVSARDKYPHKVRLIAEGAARLGLPNVRPALRDAAVYDPDDEQTADALLIDAPCSGMGLLRGKPDVRLKAEAAVAELAAEQRRIIGAGWRYVKRGGTLVYSVCTVTREEAEDMADWIAAELPFKAEERRLIAPGERDGFFMARFTRR